MKQFEERSSRSAKPDEKILGFSALKPKITASLPQPDCRFAELDTLEVFSSQKWIHGLDGLGALDEKCRAVFEKEKSEKRTALFTGRELVFWGYFFLSQPELDFGERMDVNPHLLNKNKRLKVLNAVVKALNCRFTECKFMLASFLEGNELLFFVTVKQGLRANFDVARIFEFLCSGVKEVNAKEPKTLNLAESPFYKDLQLQNGFIQLSDGEEILKFSEIKRGELLLDKGEVEITFSCITKVTSSNISGHSDFKRENGRSVIYEFDPKYRWLFALKAVEGKPIKFNHTMTTSTHHLRYLPTENERSQNAALKQVTDEILRKN